MLEILASIFVISLFTSFVSLWIWYSVDCKEDILFNITIISFIISIISIIIFIIIKVLGGLLC